MTLTNQGTGRAHGKAILMGEHAVVYGFPAIAVPLPDLKVTATATLREGDSWLACSYYQGPLGDVPGELAGLHLLVAEVLKRFRWQWSVGVSIESDIPAGYGLGSSAAVAAAVARALYHLADAALSREALLDLVAISETVCHGAPSGVDALVTTGLNPLWFVRGNSPELISIPVPMFLVVATSSQSSNTRDTVQQVRVMQERLGSGAGPVHRIGALTVASRTAIERGDYPYLGALMIEGHRELAALNVTTPELEHLIATAIHHHALGAKLTGGGGGGSIIVLAQDACQQRQLADVLSTAGAVRVWTPVIQGATS
ncbi:mevalonate kinase [Sulfobacillus harzensis]|uniref:mevalonate kinase n=1 Tax=Sulfobacillus harzensis TaxID=2729629 RepID=A0A7Y0L6K5_9FIRM|nr:mevalonate kinase [Sulfobacillus harzensis]NMP23681.1 mevalonate kinase [Sulfobacillus harzensis]